MNANVPPCDDAMVERVARAICAAESGDTAEIAWHHAKAQGTTGVYWRHARAAVLALASAPPPSGEFVSVPRELWNGIAAFIQNERYHNSYSHHRSRAAELLEEIIPITEQAAASPSPPISDGATEAAPLWRRLRALSEWFEERPLRFVTGNVISGDYSVDAASTIREAYALLFGGKEERE